MIQPTAPKMPGAIAAADASTPPPILPPLGPMGGGPGPLPPPPMAPPPMSPAPMGAPPMGPTGGDPMLAPAPAAPPYMAKVQSDGSILAVIPSPDGNPANDVVIGHMPAVKIPKALQPQPMPAAPMGAPMQ